MRPFASIGWWFLLVLFVVPISLEAEEPSTMRRYVPVNVALVTPVSIFSRPGTVVAGLNLNVLYGSPDSVYGLDLGLIVNRELSDLMGIQVAGVTNVVGRSMFGVQVAGAVNYVGHVSAGLQLSGLYNHARADWSPSETGFVGVQATLGVNYSDQMIGVQVSPWVNVAHSIAGIQWSLLLNMYLDRFVGVQVGLMNLSWPVGPITPLYGTVMRGKDGLSQALIHWSGPTERDHPAVIAADLYGMFLTSRSVGVQAAVVNVARRLDGTQLGTVNIAVDMRGLQFSPFFNMSRLEMKGVQLAIFANGAEVYMEGLQLAIVNVCGSLHGVQIGVINICGRMRGVQLGAINIAYRNLIKFMPGLNIGL